MVQIVPIDTLTLGDRSYLVHDGLVAFVVDPQRDIDRVLTLAKDAGVTIMAVFETHLHNDYITGGYALARAVGAAYYVNAADPVTFDRVAVNDADVIEVGQRMTVRVVATPGHTHTHLSYTLVEEGQPVAVFTGGSLLYGSVGRPDLLGPDHTPTLVRNQYASAHRLADHLPDEVRVFPTHGFGSFCSVAQSTASASTMGEERRTNPALTRDEHSFIEEVLAGLDAWPAYYAHMAPLNATGPTAPDLSPPEQADPHQLRTRITAGEWVIDLRHRVAFAEGHVAGTLNFGLDGSFATYLGWLIPWGTPVTLLGNSEEQVAQAQRELVRIGIDRPAAAATGTPLEWSDHHPLVSFPRADFADLARVRHHRDVVVLDVRRGQEWTAGHLVGSVNVPLHELPARLPDVPHGEVWVHCEAGYRASIAASLLKSAGRHVVAVDDEFSRVHGTDLELTHERPSK